MSFKASLDNYARTHTIKDIEKIHYMSLLYDAVKKGSHFTPLWDDVVSYLNLGDQRLPLTDIKQLDLRIAMHCEQCGLEWCPEHFEDAFWTCPDCYNREDATIFE